MIERRPITSREEWLAWRKADVTASAIGALFGVHPYVTALRLYAEKRGTEFAELEDNKILRRGRWLEPAVAAAVREKFPQWSLRAPALYLRDADMRIGATPDFYIEGDPRGLGVLQAKTVAPSVYHRDWDSGREPPLWVTLQCATEMMLADASFGAVAVLLVDAHAMECDILEVPRLPVAEEKIVAAAANFWQAVANGIEPSPDFGRDAAVIAAMQGPEVAGKQIDMRTHNELPDMLAQRAALLARIKDDEAVREAIDAEIKYLIGDAEIVTGLPDWRITYKTEPRVAYSVPAKTPRVLRIKDKRATA